MRNHLEPGSLEHDILFVLGEFKFDPDSDQLAYVLFGEDVTYEQRQQLGRALKRLVHAGLLRRQTTTKEEQ